MLKWLFKPRFTPFDVFVSMPLYLALGYKGDWYYVVAAIPITALVSATLERKFGP